LAKNSSSKRGGTKAGALLCPSCCVEYVEVQFDFEVDGVVLHDVKALRCPRCEEEVFSPQQQEEIRKKIEA
jgi:hypothetical protein